MQMVIDGDMLLYKVCYCCEVETKWTDDLWTLHTNESELKHEVDRFITGLSKKLKDADPYIVFSPKTNFRYRLFPAYKAARKDKRKPMCMGVIKQWILDTYSSIEAQDMEADDWIGIMCTELPNQRIAVSGDKDFGTLPITWYNQLTGKKVTTSPEEAQHFHLVQTLAGDVTDGYMGIKGVGVKTAEKILDKNGESWDTIVEAYEKADMSEEDALLTARLAYILQSKNYNRITKEITLWTPDSLNTCKS